MKELDHQNASLGVSEQAQNTLQIAILGLGYVGFSVVENCLKAGFSVLGIDININRINELKSGTTVLNPEQRATWDRAIEAGDLIFATSFDGLSNADVVFICVPTPNEDIGHKAIESCADAFAEHGNPEALVVVESTVRPNYIVHLQARLGHGGQVMLAYAPERVDPNRQDKYSDSSLIPRVLAGVDERSTQKAEAVFRGLGIHFKPLSLKEVEMVKILENAYRLINISFINEVAHFCRASGIDINNVIEGAATKPFGFQPFFPSVGAGGHCIPVDPVFLQSMAHNISIATPILDAAIHTNLMRPKIVVDNVMTQTTDGDTILVVGLTYKKGVSDIRESRALEVAQYLSALNRKVLVFDECHIPSEPLKAVELEAGLQQAKVVLYLVEQSEATFERINNCALTVFDTTGKIERGISV